MADSHTETSGMDSGTRVRSPRARSLPSPWPFRAAACFSSLFILCLVAAATALACVLVHPEPLAKDLLVGALIGSAVTWLAALLKRRSVLCPLCKGTPLLSTRARVHTRAWCLWPLNHGVTAIISIIVSQKFRCMYCGSDFDLLKPRSRLRHGTQPHEETE
jgi:uncharacterized membrane protein